MGPTLPVTLSFNAGYFGAIGILALQGLVTTHATGNFVTLGTAVALVTIGAVAKLLPCRSSAFSLPACGIRHGPEGAGPLLEGRRRQGHRLG